MFWNDKPAVPYYLRLLSIVIFLRENLIYTYHNQGL